MVVLEVLFVLKEINLLGIIFLFKMHLAKKNFNFYLWQQLFVI